MSAARTTAASAITKRKLAASAAISASDLAFALEGHIYEIDAHAAGAQALLAGYELNSPDDAENLECAASLIELARAHARATLTALAETLAGEGLRASVAGASACLRSTDAYNRGDTLMYVDRLLRAALRLTLKSHHDLASQALELATPLEAAA